MSEPAERRLQIALAKADAEHAEGVAERLESLANDAVRKAREARAEASRLRFAYLDLADRTAEE